MKKRIISFILLFTSLAAMISCQSNKAEDVFITENNEYWCVYNDSIDGYYNIYYKFRSDSVYDRYSIDSDGIAHLNNVSGHNSPGIRKWYISQDSIVMLHNHAFDLVSYNEKVIILSNENKNIFLIKENASNRRKGGKFFYNKRLNYPEKYK